VRDIVGRQQCHRHDLLPADGARRVIDRSRRHRI